MGRKEIEKVFLISLLLTTLIGLMQISASFLFGSLALLAVGIESLSDSITTVVALGGFRISRKPADKRHHYGHWQAESLVALLFAVVLLVSGARILLSSVDRLRHGTNSTFSSEVLLTPSLSAIVFVLLASYKMKVGKEEKCLPLISDAYHTFMDFLSSISVVIGLVLAIRGNILADPIVALIISGILFYLSFSLGRSALSALMETAPSEDTVLKIRKICAETPGVESFHRLRTRRSGPKIFVDVHVLVDSEMSLRKAHDVATEIERRLKSKIPEISSVTVHVEPHARKVKSSTSKTKSS
ncbi:MAG: cation diffusion facilitator family transporter [Candidatus Hadarchaeales archaeon]